MISDRENAPVSVPSLAGMKVTVMGLGLNGGGSACAKYLSERGAAVTVTDMKTETELASSIENLSRFPVRYVLGRHVDDDFRDADMVIKNPAVRPDSRYLAIARRVETDLSLFLSFASVRIIGITGSKGKSSTASAIHHTLKSAGRDSYLGGNITVSPLSFIDSLKADSIAVLELSSWQLGDLKGRRLLKPESAVLSAILPDHLDRYGTMDAYVADKRLIYADQDRSDFTICDHDSEWGQSFAKETRGTVLFYSGNKLPEGATGGYLRNGTGYASVTGDDFEEVVPEKLLVKGPHQKKNMLAASIALLCAGLDHEEIRTGLSSFPGVPHRLEFFAEIKGIKFYNDSAATIPEAAAACISSFETPLVLITGGTDKALDFSPIAPFLKRPKEIILLAGTGTDKLLPLIAAANRRAKGPFDNIKDACREAMRYATQGDSVALSPGCTSFGMFANEFDRGDKFRNAVLELTGKE